MTASAPAAAAAPAASAEATCASTRAPPACARITSSGRSPNENDTHGTRSSIATSRRSSCGKSSTRFTQNGRSVSRAIERICSRSTGGSVQDAPSVPRPPAWDTSPASRAAAPRPSGACISGLAHPSTLIARAYSSTAGEPRSGRARPSPHLTTSARPSMLNHARGEPMSTRNLADEDLTQAVVASFEGAKTERFKQIAQSLVNHLHAFATDVQLTEDEWFAAIDFLTRTGHITDDKRQEFILLSDVLGLSMLVVGMNNRRPPEATESTVFGPFFVESSPAFENGDDIGAGAPGEPCFVSGRVLDVDGTPIPGAL